MASSSIKAGQSSRAFEIDALRGLAILLMVLSSVIPFGVLPSWMYHAQEPPPQHMFNPNLPGITWVDLVFPFFLFSMGAAIPFSLTHKLKQNNPKWKIVFSLLNRSFLLAAFAIYIHNISPHVISLTPDWRTWLLCMLGFILLFPILCRFPIAWSQVKIYTIKASGIICAALLIIFIHYYNGSPFSLYESDIIILVLSNVAFFGGVIWLVSRRNWILRIGFMGALIAIRLSSALPSGLGSSLWHISPFPWLFDMRFLQYLMITIPGTIAGDLVLKFSKNSSEIPNQIPESNLVLIIIPMIVINLVTVIGLKARMGYELTAILVLLLFFSWSLIKKTFRGKNNLLTNIFKWGTYWLVIGFLFEPFEGGIKKDPATLSYYFITSGLAIFILIAFHITIELLKKKNILKLLIDSGQNPLVAYAGVNNLVIALLSIFKIYAFLEALTTIPWLGAIRGAFITFLVAYSTTIFTKRKIFLRA